MDWNICNNSLLLTLRDGSIYHPSASELYEQKDDKSFVYADESYAPLSTTELRFSGLTAHIKAEFVFNGDITFALYNERNSVKHYVASYNNRFNDYIIYDNTWKYIDPKLS